MPLLKITTKISSRMKELADIGATAARLMATEAAQRAAEIAKQNVAIGEGPSPHPHHYNNYYKDTGNLAESVEPYVKPQGFLTTSGITSNLQYGIDLEVGWVTTKGQFYRYTWMQPAWDEMLTDFPDLVRAKWGALTQGLGGDMNQDEMLDYANIAKSTGVGYRRR